MGKSSGNDYYLEVSNIDTVYATEVIVAEGATAIVEWLAAAFATIGLGEAAYENLHYRFRKIYLYTNLRYGK